MARPWVRTGSRSRMAQASRWGRPPSPTTFSGQVSQKGTPWAGRATTASRWGRRRPRPTPMKRPSAMGASCLLLLFLLVLAAAALFLVLLVLLHVRAAAATAAAAAAFLRLALGVLRVLGLRLVLRVGLGVLGAAVPGLGQGRLRAEAAHGRGRDGGGTPRHQGAGREEGGGTNEFRDHEILLRAHPRQGPPRGPGNSRPCPSPSGGPDSRAGQVVSLWGAGIRKDVTTFFGFRVFSHGRA